MKTTDLFKFNRSSARINESIEKTFGRKINFSDFDLIKLEDARNKLRTQLSQIRSESGFNENLENDAFHQAQWILDAINSEIASRDEMTLESENTTESQGEEMTKVTEGEIQQAQSIVTAKTMVDGFGAGKELYLSSRTSYSTGFRKSKDHT
jgi:hypothetical protein